MHPNIVGLLVNERSERRQPSFAVPFNHDPGIKAGIFWSARPRQRVEKPLARRTGGETRRIIDIPQDTEQRRPLFYQGDNRLRIDGAVLQRINNCNLYLRGVRPFARIEPA